MRKKNPAAVVLGRLGGRAASAKRTPEERAELARQASTVRWEGHVYSKKKNSVYQRARRAKIKEK
jgi:hypothetical protein